MIQKISKSAKAVKYPGIVQGSDVQVATVQREDGTLAFPLIAPKADVKLGQPRKVFDDRLKVFVTRTAFHATANRAVKPNAEQRAALKAGGPVIDRSWVRRQKRVLAQPAEATPATRPVTFGGRDYSKRVKAERRSTWVTTTASVDRSYSRFFTARKVGGGGLVSYRPEPSVTFWSDTPGGRDKPAHVKKAEQKAAADKQKLAGKTLRKVDDATAAVRDLYNALNAWHTRLGIATDEYQANPCKETRTALKKAAELPLAYPDLMRAAATSRWVEILVYGVIDWYETWCDCLRETDPGLRELVSWPVLPRAKGDLVRQWEQTVWFVEIEGVQHRHQERARWCSPEGAGMTAMDWEAAREGGYYRLRRERVGKRLRERADDLGWTFVYDTHDGKPIRTLVPYVPGEHRRLMVTIGGPIGTARVGYSHKFKGTDRFVPAAIETSGEIELVFIPYGKARQDKVTGFIGTDRSDCQARGRHAPIVQYRTCKLAFARRDLRARDAGESNAYYCRSVEQRKASRVRNARRDVDNAVRLICYAMGSEAGLMLCKQLDAEQVVSLGKKVAASPALCA